MALFTAETAKIAEAITALNFTNPFLEERGRLERLALGSVYRERGAVWSVRHGADANAQNIGAIKAMAEKLVEDAFKAASQASAPPSEQESTLYANLVVYVLFERYHERFTGAPGNFSFYNAYERDFNRLLHGVPGLADTNYAADKVFAVFYQGHRAFTHIFEHLAGTSMPVARLRATVWESIFTRDIRRYYRSLHNRMGDVATLITGPSGAGKELVARAIALARFIPFDPKKAAFVESPADHFYPLHLSAMPATLVASELFGHRKGAFTGAVHDRAGWLELCSPCGSVFLDEIGEIDQEIQVKLLRVLQDRTFQRLGDSSTQPFRGKIISATNRDLGEEISQGRFRPDLYYRLCSDMILVPSLREQLLDTPSELGRLIHFLAVKIAGPEEADWLADETARWVKAKLGDDYDWPGNVRELEQCVRNVMLHGSYVPPPRPGGGGTGAAALAAEMASCSLDADELLQRYCRIVHAKTGSYSETARLLGLDRRTVKAKLDAE